MYLQSAVRLAGHWLRTVTSVRWAHVGSEESLILLRGARASFMAVEQCAKKINRERPERRVSSRSQRSGPLATGFLTGRHVG